MDNTVALAVLAMVQICLQDPSAEQLRKVVGAFDDHEWASAEPSMFGPADLDGVLSVLCVFTSLVRA